MQSFENPRKPSHLPCWIFSHYRNCSQKMQAGSQDGCQVYARNRKYQNWCWRWEGSLKEEIVQKCCWIFIYNSKNTPREPVGSMPLSIILHDQKVWEITESHQCKNSVMYCKNLMLSYFIIWKMKKEVLWKFCAGQTQVPLPLFYSPWRFFTTSYESDIVIPHVITWHKSFCS